LSSQCPSKVVNHRDSKKKKKFFTSELKRATQKKKNRYTNLYTQPKTSWSPVARKTSRPKGKQSFGHDQPNRRIGRVAIKERRKLEESWVALGFLGSRGEGEKWESQIKYQRGWGFLLGENQREKKKGKLVTVGGQGTKLKTNVRVLVFDFHRITQNDRGEGVARHPTQESQGPGFLANTILRILRRRKKKITSAPGGGNARDSPESLDEKGSYKLQWGRGGSVPAMVRNKGGIIREVIISGGTRRSGVQVLTACSTGSGGHYPRTGRSNFAERQDSKRKRSRGNQKKGETGALQRRQR